MNIQHITGNSTCTSACRTLTVLAVWKANCVTGNRSGFWHYAHDKIVLAR